LRSYFFPQRFISLVQTILIKRLAQITDTADKLCKEVATSGGADREEVTGNVAARLLAKFGIEIGGAASKKQWDGIPPEDLANALKNNTDCRQKVFELLQAKLLPPSGPVIDPPQGSNISGIWHDTADPTSEARISQQNDQFEFTKTGALVSGVRYEISGKGKLWGNTFTAEYLARYQTGITSTGTCWGASPRDGFETATCKDTVLGVYMASMVRE
jgi:hypothetical protein